MAGLRVGVTAGRRGGELVEALTRQGARVTWAPTVEVIPAAAGALGRQTAAVLAARPSWVLVTTAEGLNRWVAGARQAQARVLALLASSKVAARGAKASVACRAHGVATVLTSPTERGADLARLVVELAAPGEEVAVVADGSGSPGVLAELAAAGLVVHVVAPYRWTVPAAVHDTLSGGGVGRVLVAAIGPVTAEALEGRRVGVGVCPLQPRIPALATALAAAPIGFRSFGRAEPLLLDPRRRTVTGPGGAVELSDLQFALLASLSRRPGLTCPTSVLLREVWGEGVISGAGARRRLEVLASRLRARLVSIDVNLATVPKRGYRLEMTAQYFGALSDGAPPVG